MRMAHNVRVERSAALLTLIEKALLCVTIATEQLNYVMTLVASETDRRV